MSGISLASAVSFGQSIEAGLKAAVSGFEGFGQTLTTDLGAVVVDAETFGNIVLNAFAASGNIEAGVIAPAVGIGEALVNMLLGLAKVQVAAPAIAPTGTAQGNLGDDGLGDSNSDTGAVGG